MNLRLLGVACVAMVAGLSGCASPARVIKSDSASVLVAVPDQTNDWPFHYRDEAQKVAATYISDPVLVGTNRVKVGESVVSTQNTDRRDLGGKDNKAKFGEATSTTTTTAASDTYEYHLEFQSRAAGRSSLPTPTGQPFNPAGPIQQTGGTQPPPLPAVGGAPRRDNFDTRLPAVNPPAYTPPGSFPSAGQPLR